MRRAEQLHEEILAQMDLSKEASDEELLELIHRILEEKSKEEFIPLGEKAILGRELFNAFRKLDILQELIEDEEITEIMIKERSRFSSSVTEGFMKPIKSFFQRESLKMWFSRW